LEQELGNGWVDGVHRDDVAGCLKTYAEAFEARQPFVMDYRLRRHDGEYRWISDTGRPRHDPRGNFAGYIGSCLDITERKQAEQAARELSGRLIRAQEAERARLSRELHDDITQRLARLAIDAGRVERGITEAGARETVREVRDGLMRLSEDVHLLSYKLHPALLQDLGLADALKVVCERFTRQDSIPVGVKLEGIPAGLPEDTGLCLFRVTQEALRNVARHARAKAAGVSLRRLDGGLQLAVTDSGIGFDPRQPRQKFSIGLASMQERVRLLGGELDIESAPGKGTTILAWVPLRQG
jgi:signal transduction histidine kinase